MSDTLVTQRNIAQSLIPVLQQLHTLFNKQQLNVCLSTI